MNKFPIANLQVDIQRYTSKNNGVPAIIITTGHTIDDSNYNYVDLKNLIIKNKQIGHIVFLCEPLQFSDELINLLDYLNDLNLLYHEITIESYGSYPPLNITSKQYFIKTYNLKLNPTQKYSSEILRKYSCRPFGVQFNFIYTDKDCVENILDIIDTNYISMDNTTIIDYRGYLEDISKLCIEYGWRYNYN